MSKHGQVLHCQYVHGKATFIHMLRNQPSWNAQLAQSTSTCSSWMISGPLAYGELLAIGCPDMRFLMNRILLPGVCAKFHVEFSCRAH